MLFPTLKDTNIKDIVKISQINKRQNGISIVTVGFTITKDGRPKWSQGTKEEKGR